MRLIHMDGDLPPIKRSHFGDYFEIAMPKDCGTVILGTLEHQFIPWTLRLPHQVYVNLVAQMLAERRLASAHVRGWAVYPAMAHAAIIVESIDLPECRGPMREPRCICPAEPGECPGNRCSGPHCNGYGRWHGQDLAVTCLVCADRSLGG